MSRTGIVQQADTSKLPRLRDFASAPPNRVNFQRRHLMKRVTYDVALLAPVPLEHLQDGVDVCQKEGKVAFGSRAWEVFRKLDDIRNGLTVDVYIYASHNPSARGFTVTWMAVYIGHVESINGAHLLGMKYRPPSTERYQEDNLGHWAVFWEVEDLHLLTESECVLTGRFHGLDKRKNYGRNFAPEGPILIQAL